MPRGNDLRVERAAVELVRDAEVARGWTPGAPLSKRRERAEGCDFLSTPPGGGDPHPVEVKGHGESLLKPDGSLRDQVELNVQQLNRARRDPRFRLEVVGNVTAYVAGTGEPEILTIGAADVVELAEPWKYRLRRGRLAEQVVLAARQRRDPDDSDRAVRWVS